MNVAFCWWISRQRRHNVCVMFHEVAFPFRSGQPFRHSLLAVVHRLMAKVILRSARHSFTSTDPYFSLLRTLGAGDTSISMLRICSNIPLKSYRSDFRDADNDNDDSSYELFTVGIFSSFGLELWDVLGPAIGCILRNPEVAVALLGPGEAFRKSLVERYPEAADRISSTGRLHVTEAGEHMRRCDALLQLYPDGASAARGTLIGAMASGVPVVTTSGPITDRLLLDSRAMLFPDGTPESIREAIELLKENPALARELGTRAQRLYEEHFQPAVIVSKLREAVSPSNHPVSLEEQPAMQR
jgi:glycosyltransferase involved in cell wall biosynthesis